MCIRDSHFIIRPDGSSTDLVTGIETPAAIVGQIEAARGGSVSYTHLRAHETVLDLVCRLLLEKKKKQKITDLSRTQTLNNKRYPYTNKVRTSSIT